MKTAISYTNCIISVSSQTARTTDLYHFRLILHVQATIKNFMIHPVFQRRNRNISHISCTFHNRVNSSHLLIQFARYLDSFSYNGIKIPTDSLLKAILLRQKHLIYPHLVPHMSVGKLCHYLFRWRYLSWLVPSHYIKQWRHLHHHIQRDRFHKKYRN